jgi:hypothetical protein
MAEEAKNILKNADMQKATETMVNILLRFYLPLAKIYDPVEASERASILFKTFMKTCEKESK